LREQQRRPAFHGGGRPVEFASIKIAAKQRPAYGPENMPDQGDVGKMIEATKKPRDRAMVAVLYESAARLGEFLALKLGSIEKTKHGWRLHIGNGKTGRRPVLLVNSGPYLAMWISQHPSRRSPEAPLWLTMRRPSGVARNGKRKSTPRRISANCVRSLLKNMGKRAGVGKRLNPHAFRHARATELAKHLKESQLRAYMGWSQGSAMPGTYVHLSGRDTDDAILAAHGLKARGFSKPLDRPRTCSTCHYTNPNSAKRCLKCEGVLDAAADTNGRQHHGNSRRIPMAVASDPSVRKELREPRRKKRPSRKSGRVARRRTKRHK
jgi:integrase